MKRFTRLWRCSIGEVGEKNGDGDGSDCEEDMLVLDKDDEACGPIAFGVVRSEDDESEL